MSGCDPTLLELRDTLQRIFDPLVQFNGNPPLAVPDALTASGGILARSPVHSNDLQGDATIASTSVSVIAGPANGTASVDVATGDILCTSTGGFSGTDVIYYRVQDVNGNDSTIGVLTITVL